MTTQCTKCSARLASPWKFCPACGAAAPAEIHPHPAHIPVEKSSVQGGFAGLLIGMVTAPILIIVGTLCCLTGLGAIIGIPMIIAAVCMPLVAPVVGLGSLKGTCPWCNSAVSSMRSSNSFECHICGKRIAAEDKRFIKAEPA